MADVISLLLTAKNDASKAINQVQKDLTSLQKTTQGSATNVDKALAVAGGAFAVGAFTATMSQIVSSTAELSQAGANIDRLRNSFEALAQSNGTSGSEILGSIDSVTQGTLSQTEMMKQANAAMLLGVANTGEEFSTLAKIAVDRGRAMGISMEYAFESIVKGVGRLSPLILDNLGIIVDADATYAAYAKTVGKTADALTDMEKRQALISRLKTEVANFDPNSVNDDMSSWEKLAASMSDFSAALGGLLNNSSNVIFVVDGITKSLRIMSNEMSTDAAVQTKALSDRMVIIKAQIAAYEELNKKTDQGWRSSQPGLSPVAEFIKWTNNNAIESYKQDLVVIQTAMDEIARKQKLLSTEDLGFKKRDTSGVMWKADEEDRKEAEVVADYVKQIGENSKLSKDEITKMVNDLIRISPTLQAALGPLNDLVQKFREGAEAAKAMAAASSGAMSGFNSAVFGAFEASGFSQDIISTAKSIRPAFDEALVAIENLGYSEYDTEAATMQLENQFSSTFSNITTRIGDAEKALNATGSSTKSLTKEFTSLRGIVEGIFSTAQSDFEGLGIDEILPREDAVNENARRLADIAKNGFKDQSWLEEFKNEAGGAFADIKLLMASGMDAQGAAKKVLKDFQNGLRPDLIDTNMVKDIAKRMFFVDQETTKMIDQIAQELAGELGISIEEAKGLAGSAMGNNKLSAEAKQKIIDEEFAGLKAKMGFDWGDKTATIGKGIDAGVLNKDGDLEVPIKFVRASGAWADVSEWKDGFTGGQGLIQDARPKPENTEGMNLTLDQGTFELKPVLPESAIQDQVTAIASSTPITVPITTDQAAVEGAGTTAFASFANGFMNPENLSGFGLWASTGLANSFVEYSPAYIQTGNQIGLYMMEGFKAQGLGAAIAEELTNQLNQSQKSFENSAGNAGKVWGNAFLTIVKGNVPFELLLALTDLITPEVIKKVAENGNRGGDK